MDAITPTKTGAQIAGLAKRDFCIRMARAAQLELRDSGKLTKEILGIVRREADDGIARLRDPMAVSLAATSTEVLLLGLKNTNAVVSSLRDEAGLRMLYLGMRKMLSDRYEEDVFQWAEHIARHMRPVSHEAVPDIAAMMTELVLLHAGAPLPLRHHDWDCRGAILFVDGASCLLWQEAPGCAPRASPLTRLEDRVKWEAYQSVPPTREAMQEVARHALESNEDEIIEILQRKAEP
jgi:hypothetical protein